MHSVKNTLHLLRVFGLLDETLVHENFAGIVLNLLDAFLSRVAHLDHERVQFLLKAFDQALRLFVQVLVLAQVYL